MRCPHVMAGPDGRLSFSKCVALLVLGAGCLPHPIATVLGVAIIAASFGIKAFLAFIGKASFQASASESRSVVETIIEQRRDPADGIEETK